jgi:hypothetical protein
MEMPLQKVSLCKKSSPVLAVKIKEIIFQKIE